MKFSRNTNVCLYIQDSLTHPFHSCYKEKKGILIAKGNRKNKGKKKPPTQAANYFENQTARFQSFFYFPLVLFLIFYQTLRGKFSL